MTRLLALAVIAAATALGAPADGSAWSTAAAGGPLAAPAAAKPALRMTSITPAVAQRGALVTVHGGGFGGRNVAVTFGGERVAVQDATGSRFRFRVPALGRVGRVNVQARNPGGRVGSISLKVLFDGNTLASVDETAATGVSIGAAGGEVSVAGTTLAIPPGALPEATTITLTPLRSLKGSPFDGAVGGVLMEPSGVVLLKPARLTLPRQSAVEPSRLLAFGFNGDGQGMHAVPHTLTADAVVVHVWHFSGAGTAVTAAEERETVFGYEPTPAHELAEQRIAAAVSAAADGTDPALAIMSALVDWHVRSVKPGLEAAVTGRLAFFELAVGEWQAWLGFVQEYRDTLSEAQGRFLDSLLRDTQFPLALDAAAAQARRLLGRCTGEGDPVAPLRNVLRLANAVNLLELPIETRTIVGERDLPEAVDLASACLNVEIRRIEHATILARARDNRYAADAEVVFWAGPPSTSIALHFRLADTTGGPPVPIASDTVSDGRFVAAVRPTTVGFRRLTLAVELAAASGDDVLRTLSAFDSVSVRVRERIELDGRRAGDVGFSATVPKIAPGDAVTLRIRLAGDDVAGASVTLAHDGAGTLPASATTDARGEAIVGYVAPPTTGLDRISATVTDDVLDSTDTLVIRIVAPITVTVAPATVVLTAGQQAQFDVDVANAFDSTVAWAATGGTITQSGLYTAGSTAGTFAVAASSVEDPTKSGTALVTIVGTCVGRYTITSVTPPISHQDLQAAFVIETTGPAIALTGTAVAWKWIVDGSVREQSDNPFKGPYVGDGLGGLRHVNFHGGFPGFEISAVASPDCRRITAGWKAFFTHMATVTATRD